MNREIKFRGWFQGINGQEYWAYGYLVKQENGNWEITNGETSWTVDNVGQFTGLLDKNGKEIYEGDVVVLSLSKDSGANGADGIIEWSKMASQWWIRFNYDKKRYKELTPDYGDENYYCQYLEITGNIYVTPPSLGTNK